MTVLYDSTGRPLAKRKTLDREIAAPQVGSVRPPAMSTFIAGLDPYTLARYMMEAAKGNPKGMLATAATMEKRWHHYRSVIGSRRMSVIGLPRVVIAETDDDADISLAEELTSVIRSDAAGDGIVSATDAMSKGYSLTEIIWDRTSVPWRPVKFRWRRPEHFVFDSETLEEVRLLTEAEPSKGEALEPGKWLTHCPSMVMGLPIEGSLAWACASLYMLASMGLRDWASFIEVFGMPIRIGRVPEGTSQESIDDFLDMLVRIGTDAAGVLKGAQDIKFEDRGRVPGSKDIFIGYLDWLNKQASKVVLGQTSSSEGGTSLAHATQQEEVRQDLVRADAEQLGRSWTRDVCRPYTIYNRGQNVAVPRAELVVEDAEDLKEWSAALVPFLNAGLRVEASQVRDKFRLDAPADDAETIGGGKGELSSSSLNRVVKGLPPKQAQVLQSRRVALWANNRGLHTHSSGVLFRRRKRVQVQVPRRYRRRPSTHEVADQDEVDNLTSEAVGGWREAMQPVVDALQSEIDAAEDEDDLVERLEKVLSPDDLELFIKTVGVGMFSARGLGDVADHPSGDPEA